MLVRPRPSTHGSKVADIFFVEPANRANSAGRGSPGEPPGRTALVDENPQDPVLGPYRETAGVGSERRQSREVLTPLDKPQKGLWMGSVGCSIRESLYSTAVGEPARPGCRSLARTARMPGGMPTPSATSVVSEAERLQPVRSIPADSNNTKPIQGPLASTRPGVAYAQVAELRAGAVPTSNGLELGWK